MSLFKFVTRPVRDLAGAVLMPFKAAFVVGLCALINGMTYRGHWWVQWVALGMGIAVVVAWARAARTIVVLALVAWAGWWLHRRYGAEARARFDDWVGRTRPQAVQVLERVRRGGATA